jgi:membrane protease YdiL (CAAX protease family)
VNEIPHEGEEGQATAKWLRPEIVAPWWEIVPVLCVMLGPFAWSAVSHALEGANLSLIEKLINTRGLTRNTALEAGLLAAFLFYLRWRGWRPADFKIRIDLPGTLLAPPLCIAASLANVITALIVMFTVLVLAPHPHGLLASLLASSPQVHLHHVELAWTIIIIGSIVNAYLEELTFMGYAFNQFAAKRNPLFALLVMVFLRMLLHTYKGPVGMLGIGAFSFVYGLTYIYTRRLWPLILAHILTDILALGVFKLLYSN